MYPKASNEAERLRALQDLDILQAEPEPHFDAICRTAAALFRMPISYVSLIAANHQQFMAKCGLDLDETGREGAFCNYAILSDDVFVVEDAWADPRFRESPLVINPPHVRFYAGAPSSPKRGCGSASSASSTRCRASSRRRIALGCRISPRSWRRSSACTGRRPSCGSGRRIIGS